MGEDGYRPWYVAAAIGVAIVVGVTLLVEILDESVQNAVASPPARLVTGAAGLAIFVLALAGIGVRARGRGPFAVIGASLALNSALALAPLADQPWSEAASVLMGVACAAAAVWLFVRLFRPGSPGST